MKATQDQNFVMRWRAPQPLTAAPTFSYTLTDGTIRAPVAMTQVRGDRAVSSIAADRRTLTLTAGVASVGLIGPEEGRAFLTTDEDGTFAVTIDRLDSTTAILADVLPRGISLTAAGSLSWAGYEFVIPLADTGVRGLLSWEIIYVVDGVNSVTDRTIADRGVIKVVRSPFSTGLAHSGLVAAMPNLADMVPRRQQDLSTQITAASEELILYARDELLGNSTEDDIFNPEIFKPAHIYLAAARVYEVAAQMDLADRMREQGVSLFERAMRQVTIDTNDDGLIDADEINLRETGGKPTDIRGPFILPDTQPTTAEKEHAETFPRWRGMRH